MFRDVRITGAETRAKIDGLHLVYIQLPVEIIRRKGCRRRDDLSRDSRRKFTHTHTHALVSILTVTRDWLKTQFRASTCNAVISLRPHPVFRSGKFSSLPSLLIRARETARAKRGRASSKRRDKRNQGNKKYRIDGKPRRKRHLSVTLASQLSRDCQI